MAAASIPTTTLATNTILLEGLRQETDQSLWFRYVDRYRPIVVRFARKLTPNDADAEDIAQQTMMEFCIAFRDGRYDQEKGRLRQWLFGIARNQINNWRRRRPKEVQAAGDDADTDYFARQPDDDHLSAAWDQEWQDAILRECIDQVRAEFAPNTVDAFELFALKGVSVDDVAKRLDMSTDSVYTAKRRVLKRVRELISQMDTLW
jgi:RNA polymerase sigma factor (sigma-70 family)